MPAYTVTLSVTIRPADTRLTPVAMTRSRDVSGRYQAARAAAILLANAHDHLSDRYGPSETMLNVASALLVLGGKFTSRVAGLDGRWLTSVFPDSLYLQASAGTQGDASVQVNLDIIQDGTE